MTLNKSFKRHALDFYATPPDLSQALIERSGLEILAPVWECAAGDGALGHALEAAGHAVTMSDVQARCTGSAIADFLTAPVPPGVRSVVTNAPFSLLDKFIRRGLEHLDAGRIEQLILLARHGVDMTAGRSELMARASRRIVCCWRPRWIENTLGNGHWAYGWWVWHAAAPTEGPVIQYIKPTHPLL